MENLTMTITVDAYTELVRTSEQFHYLTNLLFNTATLSYNGKSLSLDTGAIMDFMKAYDLGECEARLAYLQKEAEKEKSE